jgi:hypothetical protein
LRDILTFLAGLAILVLVAALAVPPLLDWSAHRSFVEAGIARALGANVRTEGPLDLRLLPTPRLRMQRLRVGETNGASLDAMYVRAEIALTPLLSGEVRFLDTRIGRAEIKLPVAIGGESRLPASFLDRAADRRGWALEDLRIEQFLLTLADPATGRTDQQQAETVRIQANSALGPFRVEGRTRGVPFDIALGEIGPERRAGLKLGAGGAGAARLDVDGQLALVPASEGFLRPRLAGTAKLAAGNAALPLQAQAGMTAEGTLAELKDIAIEAGEGGTIRLAGEGTMRLDEPALALRLAGRRLDLVPLRRALAASPEGTGWRGGLPFPIDLSLKLDGLALGGDEDLSRLSLAVAFSGERGELRAFEVEGPGRSRVAANGSFWLGTSPGASGHVTLAAADGQRLARGLESLGLPGLAGFLEPRPLEASAAISLVDPVVSLRSLRIVQGDVRLVGAIRHEAGEGARRPRLDAQLAIEGLDVSTLPGGAPVFALAKDRDLGITVDARNVSHGGRKGGRITGRFSTDGAAVVVDTLEVRDLAGAEATLSGRIAPDGIGRIEGQVRAPRAAPLLDLFGQVWLGGLSRLVPDVARSEAVDFGVEVEQAGAQGSSSIRTRVQGQLGPSYFEAVTQTGGGRLRTLSVSADPDALLGLPRRAGRLVLSVERGGDGRLAGTATGEIAGLALRTGKPVLLAPADDGIESGEVSLNGPDAGPLLGRLGLGETGPVPVALKLALARRDGPVLAVTGEVMGGKVAAELGGASLTTLRGSATLDRLSLPWLVSALALGPVAPAPSGAIWPTARFTDAPTLPFAGTLALKASVVDLGLGLQGRDAGFTLNAAPTGLRLSRLDMRLGEARLRGEIGLDRQGGLASLSGDAAIESLPVPALLGAPFAAGRLAAKLRFGTSGESVAALLANLGGAGDVSIEGLTIDGADPGAPGRLAQRVLRTDEPLAAQRWQPLLAEELGRAPLASASPVAAPGALVGGALRLSPLRIEAGTGLWQGAATLDLRGLALDMRGALQAKEAPRGWTGAPPTLGLGWAGRLGRLVREADSAPLVGGLATNVLARELDRVDTFDLDAAERRRRNSREEMDRQRRTDEARRLREQAPPPPPPSPVPAPAAPGAGG